MFLKILAMQMCAIYNIGCPYLHKHVFIIHHCNLMITFSVTIIITYCFFRYLFFSMGLPVIFFFLIRSNA